MLNTLIDALHAAGKETKLVEGSDGARALVLPYGGRALGLFSKSNDTNFYWTNKSLDSAETAKSFYASDQWHNSGGDRTWLAPEVDVFFPKFPDMSAYFQPRQLDPGDYRVEERPDGLRLVNRLTLELHRQKRAVELEITKSFGPAPNPLRHERGIDLEGVEYAGYTQRTSLRILDNQDACVGLWNLVQMPHGGDLLIPTYVKAQPTVYFGAIPSEDLVVTDHLVRYRMRQVGEHKIGVRAVSMAGRVGYVCREGELTTLIVRNYTVDPSGEYVDVPWADLDYLGFNTQACNVNSGLGSFSELEYHIPAIGGSTGRTRCDDSAQVWAYRGSADQIEAIITSLLTP